MSVCPWHLHPCAHAHEQPQVNVCNPDPHPAFLEHRHMAVSSPLTQASRERAVSAAQNTPKMHLSPGHANSSSCEESKNQCQIKLNTVYTHSQSASGSSPSQKHRNLRAKIRPNGYSMMDLTLLYNMLVRTSRSRWMDNLECPCVVSPGKDEACIVGTKKRGGTSKAGARERTENDKGKISMRLPKHNSSMA